MVDVAFSVGGILLALFLVILNGFFVASEFAFVRIRSTTVETLVEEGRTGAAVLEEAVDNLDDYLATTQLGITIASLGLGWVGEPAMAALIEPVLESFLPESAISLVAFAVGFGFITFLHVVFGELAPKTIAIQKAERISLLVAPPMKFFYYLFLPGIIVFNGTANFFTRMVGVSPASETDETLSEEEILLVLGRSGQQGAVDKEEVEMIERVFDLDDTAVRQVMIPRPDVVSVPADLTLSELRSTIVESGHTRYPVLDPENDDEIVGFVDVKDVLGATEAGRDGSTARDLARDLIIIPETGRIDDLLEGFQRDRSQMAAVIDEWGAFEGIVTIEDVVEELVGDLQDQFDVDDHEPSIERLDGAYLIDGGVSITTVNEALDAEFERTEFETIGGLVFDRLGRAPEVDDAVSVNGYRLTVEGVDGARISSVVVQEESAGAEESDSSG
ncbi:hemolysin family protein [Halalkalicoccus ordinarius]|uniref:hemolysin family protein n=1 Tax=Halalkalicoccus ordinarius TaxID=3116651 RepID=UPI00300F5537